MKKEKNTIYKYDKLCRIKSIRHSELDLNYNYVYDSEKTLKCHRKEFITSKKNKSNHKTITLQRYIGNKYVNHKKIEEGDIYKIITHYNEYEQEIKIKRINKIANTVYSKVFIKNKKGENVIWIEEYNKKKSIGFKVDLNLIFSF
jgi:hypothetical protein